MIASKMQVAHIALLSLSLVEARYKCCGKEIAYKFVPDRKGEGGSYTPFGKGQLYVCATFVKSNTFSCCGELIKPRDIAYHKFAWNMDGEKPKKLTMNEVTKENIEFRIESWDSITGSYVQHDHGVAHKMRDGEHYLENNIDTWICKSCYDGGNRKRRKSDAWAVPEGPKCTICTRDMRIYRVRVGGKVRAVQNKEGKDLICPSCVPRFPCCKKEMMVGNEGTNKIWRGGPTHDVKVEAKGAGYVIINTGGEKRKWKAAVIRSSKNLKCSNCSCK